MAEAVAIIPDFPVEEQIQELATHFSRSSPSTEPTLQSLKSTLSTSSTKDSVQTLVQLIKASSQDGGACGLEGSEKEVEQAYLLLGNLLVQELGSGEEYEAAFEVVRETVVKGVEGGKGRGEVGLKVLTNSYNLLPSTSPLRPTVLLSLLTLLSSSTTTSLSSLSLTPSYLSSLPSTSPATKSSFLSSVAQIYTPSSPLQALEIRILSLKAAEGQVLKEDAEKTLILALSLSSKFDFEEILSVGGVKGALEGDLGYLVDVLEGNAGEGVGEGLKWVESKSSWLEGLSIPAKTISRKLRLLTLVSLAASVDPSSRTLSYEQIAKGLEVDLKEVEKWVIDAIHCKLITAKLSQPTQTLQISSVSTRSFGTTEWKLLEKRIGEWKDTVDEVQKVVGDAMLIGSQVEGGEGGGGRQRRQGKGQGQHQHQNQNQPREERQPQQEQQSGQAIVA